MFHADDCNHSCTRNANYSCDESCNASYMSAETLADRIKAIRNAAGDSLSEAGKKVGVSRQAFDKWEKGDTENMKIGNLLRFCDRYQVNIEGLIRGNGEAVWKRFGSAPSRPVLVAQDGAAEAANAAKKDELAQDQKRLLAAFGVAGQESRRIFLQIADGILADFAKRNETN